MNLYVYLEKNKHLPQCVATTKPYRCTRANDGHFVHWSWGTNREGKQRNIFWTED